MAEHLQTADAALGLATFVARTIKVAIRVKNAVKISKEIHQRVSQVETILNHIEDVLERRQTHAKLESSPFINSRLESTICETVESCSNVLQEISEKFDLVDDKGNVREEATIKNRLRIALRTQSIDTYMRRLDSPIAALTTFLILLQIDDKLDPSSNADSSQSTLKEALPKLERQLNDNERLIRSWRQNLTTDDDAYRNNERRKDSVHDEEPNSGDSITDLESRNNIAIDLYDEYSTKAIATPGPIQGNFFDSRNDSSLMSLSSLHFDSQPHPVPHSMPQQDIPTRESGQLRGYSGLQDSIPDREVLDAFIKNYYDAAARERDAHHHQQAEVQLIHAVRWNDIREVHYGVPFVERLQMYEELAILYQRQGKYGDAISQVGQLRRRLSSHSLTNEDGMTLEKLASARYNQLLASIYFDRYKASTNVSKDSKCDISGGSNDLESAEKYGQAAFKARNTVRKSTGDLGLDLQQHRECICLIIDIYEAKGDPTGAKYFREILDDSPGAPRARRFTDSTLTEDDRSLLREEGAILQSVRSGDSDATAGLIRAVKDSNKDAVIKLLDPNDLAANVNTADDEGYTALHHAAKLGDHGLVHCLLQYDADKDCMTFRNETPLLIAVQEDHREVAKLLLDSGVRAQRRYANDWSLLHFAIRKDTTDMTKLLLKRSPDLKNAKDNVGMTALHHCARNSADRGFLEQARILLELEKPADVDAQDEVMDDDDDDVGGGKGRTPLYIAVSCPAIPEREKMAALLIKHGAKVDTKSLPRKYLRDYDCLRTYVKKK